MSVNFPEEIVHLEQVTAELKIALKKSKRTIAGYEEDHRESKRYLAAYWSELDPMERFSNQQSIGRIEAAGDFSTAMGEKLEKLLDSPYFARIDFEYVGETELEKVYIGKSSFADGKSQMLIFDWRAPISNVYYEYELGPASYEAPAGTVTGNLALKRQFRIRAGRMEYALESSMNIGDDILQRELSSTSDEKMKSIIATIQREQNQIIRNEKAQVLIIQGGAGSGKTSIALHRIAYLLYRYKERLAASNVAIISPNKVFADYISNVLPELGEEPILEIGFEDLAAEGLEGTLQYERQKEQAEETDSKWTERVKFKSSPKFVQILNQYLEHADHQFFKAADCGFGRFTIEADYLSERYSAYRNYPILVRFDRMTSDILDRIKTENLRGFPLPSRNEIMKKLRSLFQMGDTLQLYSDFYRSAGRTELFVRSNGRELEWEDVFPYLYVKLFYEGMNPYRTVRHMIIDEMQDYTPIQYAVINQLFQCRKTILGDFGQAAAPFLSYSPVSFQGMFDSAEMMVLTKSYRSTLEIIEFAKRIKPDQKIEAVERHGTAPTLTKFKDWADELASIKEAADEFYSSPYATLGILCKTSSQAKKLWLELSADYEIHLLDHSSTRFENGITVTAIPVSKGLEFDEVIIPFASSEEYRNEFDRNLLYIGSTRAMHRLRLTHQGDPTPLINQHTEFDA